MSVTSSRPKLGDPPPAVHTHACTQCGGPVEDFDRFCPSCGHEQASEAAVVAEPALVSLRCENCGAEVRLEPSQRSYTCPFCASNYVVEMTAARTDRQPPEFVIGFALTPIQAMEKFRAWLGNGWFRPGDLSVAAVADKMKGVYLPFWSFTMLARSTWTATIGEYWYRTETYTTEENGKTVTKTRTVQETEWWPLAGRHHRYYSGYLVTGSRGLAQREADRIQPFHLAGLHRYAPSYLAGWLCEEYCIERDAALEVCQNEFYARVERDVGAMLPGDTYRSLTVNTAFDDVNSDLVLLPIYLLSYRYRDKLYRFMVNGQTGKAAGDKPLSWRKILALVGGVLVAIVLLLVLARVLG